MTSHIDGATRRQAIIEYLEHKTTPTNGAELARQFNVSRQVIVQDIALLRAENSNIMSTNKGYMLFCPQEKSGHTAIITVRHSAEDTLEEMRSILDYGGSMLDVFIDHDLYGQIRADLLIQNLQDAEEFCAKMRHSNSRPLKVLTDECHYHTIIAPSEKALDMIKKDLKEKNFLLD